MPDIPYTLQRAGRCSHQCTKWPFPLGGSRPQHNAWFLGPNRDHSPNGTSINTYGCRAFSLAGPMAWNSLPSGIQRAAQTVLGVYLKRTCSRVTSASSALGVLNDYALYKSTHSLSNSLARSVYPLYHSSLLWSK